METSKKITVRIPQSLLKKAQKISDLGITATIRQGLQLVAAGKACENLRRLKGKVKFSVDLKTLRNDRT